MADFDSNNRYSPEEMHSLLDSHLHENKLHPVVDKMLYHPDFQQEHAVKAFNHAVNVGRDTAANAILSSHKLPSDIHREVIQNPEKFDPRDPELIKLRAASHPEIGPDEAFKHLMDAENKTSVRLASKARGDLSPDQVFELASKHDFDSEDLADMFTGSGEKQRSSEDISKFIDKHIETHTSLGAWSHRHLSDQKNLQGSDIEKILNLPFHMNDPDESDLYFSHHNIDPLLSTQHALDLRSPHQSNALKYAKLPDSTVRNLINNYDEATLDRLKDNKHLSPENVTDLYNKGIKKAALHPAASPEILDRYYKEEVANHYKHGQSNFLLIHGNKLPVETQKDIAQNGTVSDVKSLLRDKDINTNVVTTALKHPDKKVRKKASLHPSVSHEAVPLALKNGDIDHIDFLTRSGSYPPEVLNSKNLGIAIDKTLSSIGQVSTAIEKGSQAAFYSEKFNALNKALINHSDVLTKDQRQKIYDTAFEFTGKGGENFGDKILATGLKNKDTLIDDFVGKYDLYFLNTLGTDFFDEDTNISPAATEVLANALEVDKNRPIRAISLRMSNGASHESFMRGLTDLYENYSTSETLRGVGFQNIFTPDRIEQRLENYTDQEKMSFWDGVLRKTAGAVTKSRDLSVSDRKNLAPPLVSALYNDHATADHKKQAVDLLSDHILGEDIDFEEIDPDYGKSFAGLVTNNEQFVADFVVDNLSGNQFKRYVGGNTSEFRSSPKIYEAFMKKLTSDPDWDSEEAFDAFSGGDTIRSPAFQGFVDRLHQLSSDPANAETDMGTVLGRSYARMLDYGAISVDEVVQKLKGVNPQNNPNFDNALVELISHKDFSAEVDAETVQELLANIPSIYHQPMMDSYLEHAPYDEAIKVADLSDADQVKSLIEKPRNLSPEDFESITKNLDSEGLTNLYDKIFDDNPTLLFGTEIHRAFNDSNPDPEQDKKFLDKINYHATKILENQPLPIRDLSRLIAATWSDTLSSIVSHSSDRPDIVAKAVYNLVDHEDIKSQLGLNILSSGKVSDEMKNSIAQDLINRGQVVDLLVCMWSGIYTPLGSQSFSPSKEIKKQVLNLIKSPDFLSSVSPKTTKGLIEDIFRSGILSSVSDLSSFYKAHINQVDREHFTSAMEDFLHTNPGLLESPSGANFLKGVWNDSIANGVYNSRMASLVIKNDKIPMPVKSSAFWSTYTDLPVNTDVPAEILTDKKALAGSRLHADSKFFSIISNPANAKKLALDDIKSILSSTAPAHGVSSNLLDSIPDLLRNGSISYKNTDELLESLQPVVAGDDPFGFAPALESMLSHFSYDDGIDNDNIFGIKLASSWQSNINRVDTALSVHIQDIVKASRSANPGQFSKQVQKDLAAVEDRYIDSIYAMKDVGHHAFSPDLLDPLINYNKEKGVTNKIGPENSNKIIKMLTEEGFFGEGANQDAILGKVNERLFNSVILTDQSLKDITDRYPAVWALGVINADGFKDEWLDRIPDETFKYAPAAISREMVRYSNTKQSKAATAKVLDILSKKTPQELVTDSGYLESSMRDLIEKSGHFFDKKTIEDFLNTDIGMTAKAAFFSSLIRSTNKDPEVHQMAIEELGIKRASGHAIMSDSQLDEAMGFVLPQEDEDDEGGYDVDYLATLMGNENLTEMQSDRLADFLLNNKDDMENLGADRYDLHALYTTIADNPASSFSALALADGEYYSDNYITDAHFEVEGDFNPILSHPVHGNEFFHNLYFPEEYIVNGYEIETIDSIEHSKARTILREVSQIIPPQGISWADFKKVTDKRYEQSPIVKQLFMKAKKQHVMPEDVMKAIANDPGEFTLTYTTWSSSSQTHMDGKHDNLVVQLNAGPSLHREISKDPKVADFYHSIVKIAGNSGHPITPQIVNWVRIDNHNENAWIIEEVQSDFDATLRKEIDKLAKQNPEGTRIGNHFFSVSEMHHAAKEIYKAISGWFEASHKAVEKLARQNGVTELYMHGPNIRGAMSFSGNNKGNPYPEWLNYMYSVAPSKDPDWEQCDYTDYPEYNESLIRMVKENHKDYRSTHCWRKKLT